MTLRSSQASALRFVIVALCLLVLLFAVRVKLSQYNDSLRHPTPVSASKLWTNGQKMEMSTVTSILPVLCLSFLVFLSAAPVVRVRRIAMPLAPASRLLNLFERHRFLRPPPTV